MNFAEYILLIERLRTAIHEGFGLHSGLRAWTNIYHCHQESLYK